jgi:hypothetical protein
MLKLILRLVKMHRGIKRAGQRRNQHGPVRFLVPTNSGATLSQQEFKDVVKQNETNLYRKLARLKPSWGVDIARERGSEEDRRLPGDPIAKRAANPPRPVAKQQMPTPSKKVALDTSKGFPSTWRLKEGYSFTRT